jgi:hypothetical protein
LYGEWDQYIKHVEARLQEGAKLDSEEDKKDVGSGATVTNTLGKRKDQTAVNEEVSHTDNEPVKHENARARSLQTYQTKGTTQRGLSLKAAQTRGGGEMSDRELQMALSGKLMARKEGEPLTLQGESFFIEGKVGYPRCRAVRRLVRATPEA